MTTADFPDRGLVFWQVGTGDSTTVVIDDTHVLQIDLHDMAMADEDDAVVVPVVDRIVEALPERDGMPYLAAFVLTHADKDHCLGFADLLERVMIGEIWATPRLWREYTDHDVELCEDAKAFHEEVLQRVDETLEAVERGEEPASGDRVRVVAKKKAALRISLARRRSRTSLRSSASSARSALVIPARTPTSISARFTHARSDSSPTPSWRATRRITL